MDGNSHVLLPAVSLVAASLHCHTHPLAAMPRKGKKTKHTAAELNAKIAANKPRGAPHKQHTGPTRAAGRRTHTQATAASSEATLCAACIDARANNSTQATCAHIHTPGVSLRKKSTKGSLADAGVSLGVLCRVPAGGGEKGIDERKSKTAMKCKICKIDIHNMVRNIE